MPQQRNFKEREREIKIHRAPVIDTIGVRHQFRSGGGGGLKSLA